MKSIMMKLLMVVAVFTLPSWSMAGDDLSQEDVNQLNQDSTEDIEIDDEVEQAFDDWFAERGIEPGVETKTGKLYYSAYETVAVDPSSPAWVQARQIAFEEAMLAIQAKFITDQFGNSASKTLNSMKDNDSTNKREFEDKSLDGKSRIAAIWDKALAVGESKLNQILIENGMDPSEFDAVPAAERKDLFIGSYITQTITKAMGDSSGILPVKTFEANNSKGGHAIGVIAVYSPKFKQLAYDIAHGRDPGVAGKKGKALASWYDLPKESLAQTFGLRIGVDENGNIVLISFGQWGYSYQGNNSQQKSRSKKIAGEQAEAIAISFITNFMSSSISLNNESKRGKLVERYLLKQGDNISEKNITNMISEFSKEIKQSSSGSIAGTRTVDRWTYKHPYGHEIVGRVKIWTRQGVETSQAVKNFKPVSSSGKKEATTSKAIDTKPASVSESPEFADPDEFF